jgi:hypothetical protein
MTQPQTTARQRLVIHRRKLGFAVEDRGFPIITAASCRQSTAVSSTYTQTGRSSEPSTITGSKNDD